VITLIPDLPGQVVGIVASGQVTASDYETVVIPAIESALKTHGSVRILYQLGPAFTGFSSGAIWDDMRLGMAHLKAWDRIAIVTDLDWVAGAMRVFRFVMPCPVKVFSNREFAEAARWVSAD
jgi:SpoIIAA-like